ncbi:hypothetical protein D9M71_395590 [compost metagenome]
MKNTSKLILSLIIPASLTGCVSRESIQADLMQQYKSQCDIAAEHNMISANDLNACYGQAEIQAMNDSVVEAQRKRDIWAKAIKEAGNNLGQGYQSPY